MGLHVTGCICYQPFQAMRHAVRHCGRFGHLSRCSIAAPDCAAMPHHRPGSRTIEAGEPIVLDFGARVDGYCSDMTRTVAVGDPGPEARHVYEVVLAEATRVLRQSLSALLHAPG